jgi:ring-1,2-phenylacetyl-CoA epoxidase subunit PaaB
MSTSSAPQNDWPLWEVFVQSVGGAAHEHAGSVRAPDPELAIQNARDVYTRRGSVCSLWVVPSNSITATASSDSDCLFDPSNDKPYRHPQFYVVPRGVKGL